MLLSVNGSGEREIPGERKRQIDAFPSDLFYLPVFLRARIPFLFRRRGGDDGRYYSVPRGRTRIPMIHNMVSAALQIL